MSRLRLDPYILLLLVTVGIASLLPARGIVAVDFTRATTIAMRPTTTRRPATSSVS